MSNTSHLLYLCIVVAFLWTTGHSQNISEVRRLIKDKTANIDTSLRPVINQYDPITVNMSFNLLSIQEVNEVQQTITLNAYMELIWIDETMTWNPADYGGTGQFMADSGRFWTPSIVLANTNDKIEIIGSSSTKMRFIHNGAAYYYPGIVLTVTCRLDIRFYPWDRHACSIQFSPWGYLPEEYHLQNLSDKVDVPFYYPNGAWNLVGSYIEIITVPQVTTFYQITIFIERQATYVIVNVILPVIVLSLLNLMIYFIPTESGERISFSITLLLAVAVFLTIVADNLPKSSTPMALFSYYLLTVLVTSNCITLSIIFSLRLFHRDESEPVGSYWQCIVRVMKCQCRSKKRNRRKYKQRKQSYSKSEYDQNASTRFDPRMNSHSFFNGKHLHWHNDGTPPQMRPSRNGVVHRNDLDQDDIDDYENVKDNKDIDDTSICWQDVSIAFDRICFIFFFLLLIAASAATFGSIYVQRKKEDDLFAQFLHS
ncbi:hypothetical protein ACF0H5_008090 [Mactra antiquata]